MNVAYMKKLKTLIKELHLEKRVIFTGTVVGHDKYHLLRNAKLMIHMARWENHPISVLEGTSQGLYAVVANNSGLRDVIVPAKTGVRLKTTDPVQVAKKINYLYKHTPKINPKFLKQDGIIQSWDGVADQLIHLINKAYEKSYYANQSRIHPTGFLKNSRFNLISFGRRITAAIN